MARFSSIAARDELAQADPISIGRLVRQVAGPSPQLTDLRVRGDDLGQHHGLKIAGLELNCARPRSSSEQSRRSRLRGCEQLLDHALLVVSTEPNCTGTTVTRSASASRVPL